MADWTPPEALAAQQPQSQQDSNWSPPEAATSNQTSSPIHPAQDFVQDNPEYLNPIKGKTKMPDGSTYIGQPWQDSIFQGMTRGLHGQQGENVLAEMGRKTEEIGRGVKQAYLWGKNWNNLTGITEASNNNPELDAYNKQLAQQEQEDADLANSTGGKVGGIAFDLAEGAMLPGGLLKQAATQAALGLANPTDMEPGQSFLGNKVMEGIKTGIGSLAGGALPTVGGKLVQPFASRLSDQGTKDIAALAKNGITTLDAAQMTGNESANVWKQLVPSASFKAKQDSEVTNALLTKYAGLDEPETQQALQQKQFWAQKAGGNIETNGATSDIMGAIRDGATNTRNQLFANNPTYLTSPFNAQIENLRSRALQMSSGPHDPDAFNGILNALQSSAKKNSIGPLRQTGIPGKIDPLTFQSQYDAVSGLYNTKWAGLGGELKDAMNSAFTASAQNPQDALKLLQINQRLANLHRLEGAVGDDDNITLPALKKAMDKKSDINLTTYGSGTKESQDLWNIAQAGNRVMSTPRTNPTGIGARLVGAGATGLGIGAAEGIETGNWKNAAALAATGMLGGWAGNKMLYSGAGRAWANAAKSPLLGQGINVATRLGTAAGANQTQIPTMLNQGQQ